LEDLTIKHICKNSKSINMVGMVGMVNMVNMGGMVSMGGMGGIIETRPKARLYRAWLLSAESARRRVSGAVGISCHFSYYAQIFPLSGISG
jgi:hypothetical protein